MTLHKLSTGSGYEYLTRQVAALDSTEKGTTPLADYYSAKGESPGRWVGSGLVGIDGLDAGDVVTAEQMKHLFGTGSHPLTGEPLGAAYRVYDNTGVDGFNAEVARRVRVVSTGSTNGKPPYDVLARVRSEVARERFLAEHGREPTTTRELSDALARYSRPTGTPHQSQHQQTRHHRSHGERKKVKAHQNSPVIFSVWRPLDWHHQRPCCTKTG